VNDDVREKKKRMEEMVHKYLPNYLVEWSYTRVRSVGGVWLVRDPEGYVVNRYEPPTMFFSRKLLPYLPMEICLQTALHEVAHVLIEEGTKEVDNTNKGHTKKFYSTIRKLLKENGLNYNVSKSHLRHLVISPKVYEKVRKK